MTEPSSPSSPKCERCREPLEHTRELDEEGNLCAWWSCKCEAPDAPLGKEEVMEKELQCMLKTNCHNLTHLEWLYRQREDLKSKLAACERKLAIAVEALEECAITEGVTFIRQRYAAQEALKQLI